METFREDMNEAFEAAHEADEDTLALVLALKGVALSVADVASSLDAIHETVRAAKAIVEHIEAGS